MKMTNEQMSQATEILYEIKGEKGKLGYAIARNLRKLQDCCMDYVQIKYRALEDFGDKTEQGGKTMYNVSKEKLPLFLNEVEELANIEHEVEIYTIPAEDFFSGGLTAEQMGELMWMVELEEKKDGNKKGNEQTEI